MSAVSARPFLAPWVEMKYCSTERPSRKLAVIGVSMISPDGFAISPRMPASWRIWSLLPRAPESAIMKTGLNPSIRMGRPSLSKRGLPSSSISGAFFMASIISLATSSVALAQMSTTLLYFSPWVMRPSVYCRPISVTCSSARFRISHFFSGMIMASIEMESPPRVEYLYPISFRRSDRMTVALAPRFR